ncbi:hypothetical protein HRG84_11895 [Flavisolibacter sp. BT320]|nr:hypothetical protein [Flavisolibacter longurius]
MPFKKEKRQEKNLRPINMFKKTISAFAQNGGVAFHPALPPFHAFLPAGKGS